MTGHESHKAERDKLNEAIKEANEKPSPSSLARLVRAAFALAKVCPTVKSELVKCLKTPESLHAVTLAQYLTIFDVLKRSSKIGTSSAEVLGLTEPFNEDDEQRKALINIHALLQCNSALELLLGADYISVSSGDDILSHFGLTKEDLTTLSKDELRQRLSPGLSHEQLVATPPHELIKRFLESLPQPKTRFIDSVYEAADLVFEQRYNWPSGTAKQLSLPELWFTLEHTLDDNPNNPKSIWKLTS